jgi:glycosyltransferase involved in cell wall biosynthesis
MDRPLVSVLLPSLNARQFLDVRIESLLAQTFSNWEAVVLDSHSTDGSWEVFKSIRNGDNLLPADLIGHLTARATENLLSLDTVRTSVPGEICRHLNYRPVPHDCLLHFAGRSVYCSLTQLVVRMSSIKAVAPFETKIGSIADYEWLLRLTACAGSVHLPRKLAMWRYHGNQLSLRRGESRLGSMKAADERTLRGICERQPRQLARKRGAGSKNA